MHRFLQIFIQVVFLALFIVLIIQDIIQVWVGVFLAGLLLSLVFSRFYCGWICPINTLMRTVTKVKEKTGFRGFGIPKILKRERTRYVVLALFAGLFVFVMASDVELPVLPSLLAIGVLLTVFFPEHLFHRHLCPYGTLFNLVSRKSAYKVHIDGMECINCGKCRDVCPSNSISECDFAHHIHKKECLTCHDCVRECPVGAIAHKR